MTNNTLGRGNMAPKVLVVDDDPNLRYVIASVLADEGYAVASAADGLQALEVADHQTPDIVVLDMTLPILGGREVADHLHKTRGESIPILAITADGRAAEKAKQIGAYAYLRKPFEIIDLIEAVRNGLRDNTKGA